MQTSVRLGDRVVGAGAPCYVVAEAGVNHDGSLERATELIDAAAAAGADAVKFQTWRTDLLVAEGAALADYQRDQAGGASDQRELLSRLELPADGFAELARHAERRGIEFLSTPDEEESADLLERLGVCAFKIGSGEVTNLPFLRHVAAKGRPVILSTGMATLGEVEAAVDAIGETGLDELVLLHCVSAYPADPGDANLRAMETLRRAFGVPVGFSDHTLGTETAIAAVALGAAVLEKHLTLDRGLAGPDHALSLEPDELAGLVRAVRTVEAALGDGEKRPVPAELETRTVVRRRLLARRRLPAGTVLAESDVILRRAGSGLGAEELAAVVGRALADDVEPETPLTWELLRNP